MCLLRSFREVGSHEWESMVASSRPVFTAEFFAHVEGLVRAAHADPAEQEGASGMPQNSIIQAGLAASIITASVLPHAQRPDAACLASGWMASNVPFPASSAMGGAFSTCAPSLQ